MARQTICIFTVLPERVGIQHVSDSPSETFRISLVRTLGRIAMLEMECQITPTLRRPSPISIRHTVLQICVGTPPTVSRLAQRIANRESPRGADDSADCEVAVGVTRKYL